MFVTVRRLKSVHSRSISDVMIIIVVVRSYGCSVRSASDVALLGNGDVMYTVGSIVVIYDVTQHNQRHYLRHTATVTWYAAYPYSIFSKYRIPYCLTFCSLKHSLHLDVI